MSDAKARKRLAEIGAQYVSVLTGRNSEETQCYRARCRVDGCRWIGPWLVSGGFTKADAAQGGAVHVLHDHPDVVPH